MASALCSSWQSLKEPIACSRPAQGILGFLNTTSQLRLAAPAPLPPPRAFFALHLVVGTGLAHWAPHQVGLQFGELGENISRDCWEPPLQALRRQPGPAQPSQALENILRPATGLLSTSLSIYYQTQESGSPRSVKLGTNVEEV